MKGILFVISAPAGTGKTTLVDMLAREFEHVERSISYTTREPRNNEIEGFDYFFISKEEFEEKKKDLLEHEEVFGEMYGSSKTFIEDRLNNGKHVIMVIDTHGAMNIKKKKECTTIFLSPPNIDELESRLQGRETESKKDIQMRLKRAKKEMEMIGNYDYHIVNNDLLTAYDVLRGIIYAEEHKTKRKG